MSFEGAGILHLDGVHSEGKGKNLIILYPIWHRMSYIVNCIDRPLARLPRLVVRVSLVRPCRSFMRMALGTMKYGGRRTEYRISIFTISAATVQIVRVRIASCNSTSNARASETLDSDSGQTLIDYKELLEMAKS